MNCRPIEYSSGSPAFDLVDTVSKRGVEDIELLRSPSDLDHWLEGAGIQSIPLRLALPADLDDFRTLREALYRAVCGIIITGAPDDIDMIIISGFAAMAAARPKWVDGSIVMQAANQHEAALTLLAEDGLNRLMPTNSARIRRCPDCSIIFFDASRPGKRIWCSSSAGCGNRAKVRRHRARKLSNTKTD